MNARQRALRQHAENLVEALLGLYFGEARLGGKEIIDLQKKSLVDANGEITEAGKRAAEGIIARRALDFSDRQSHD